MAFMYKYIFLLTFFIFNLFGDSTYVTIEDQELFDDFQVSYFKAQNSDLNIKKISSMKFTKTTPNKFALGYTKGDIWFKFDIVNNSENENFIISLGESFYEKANLYYFEKQWIKKENGLFTYIKDREINTNHLSFKINIPKDQNKTIYLQLNGKYAYFGNITISKEKYFYQNLLLGVNILYIAILGIIFIIVVLNLFLYFKTKESIYIYYVGYSFFNFIYLSNISGLLIFFNLQHLTYTLQSSAGFMIGFLVLFSCLYFNTKKFLPKLNKYIYALAIPSFFFAIMIIFSYQPWNKLINNYAGIVCIILLITAIIVYFKGHNKAKYYIFAISLYFSFVVLFTFMVTGLFEYSFLTRYGYIVASVIEIVIFSLMLSSRYHDMKEEVIISKDKLLKIKETNEKLLEDQIEKRTFQLLQRYKEIENLLGQRDMLLKEVHHRVKNNFHTLIGLLWMEEQKDVPDGHKFESFRNRIKSMSIIHEKLYNSEDINNISLKAYIKDIVNNLLQSSKLEKINTKLNIENISLEFNSAVSLGIIVNEVISNTIKHNTNNRSLDISIRLNSKNDYICLIIKDNGKGFDKNIKSDGLGLSLIDSFSQKLPNSKYIFENNHGTIFTLTFNRNKND